VASAGSFDLNGAIGRWRAHLAEQPALAAGTVDELEAHLRDSLDRLEASGLSAEEAFLVAVTRVGTPQALGQEFAKVSPQSVWLDRALWMLIGVQIWGALSGLFLSLAVVAVVRGYAGRAFSASDELIGPVAALALGQLLALALSLAVCAWLIVGKGPRIVRWLGPRLRNRWTFVAAGAGLGVATLTVMAASNVARVWMGWPGSTTAAFAITLQLVRIVQVLTFVVLTLVLIRRRYGQSSRQIAHRHGYEKG
jgi:hypothetical protein